MPILNSAHSPSIFRTAPHLAAALIMSGCMGSALAAGTSVDAQALHTQIAKRLPNFPPVESVTRSPIDGPLYEMVINAEGRKEIIYTDAKGDYLLQGALLRTSDRENLTEKRLGDLQRIDFSKLPLDKAIKQVKGNGSREIAVFADPNCSFCKKLERESLAGLNNLTVYTFVVPMLGPDSAEKNKRIVCSTDPAKAWHLWMNEGVAPQGDGKCDTATLDQFSGLARQIGVSATPTMFLRDGSVIRGAVDGASIEKRLSALGTAPTK